jgi:hypothetical protein
MRILDLMATSDCLDRMYQFDDGEEYGGVPPVLIARCPDGVLEIRDGHHRLAYYRLTGREVLQLSDFWVIHVDECRRLFVTIDYVMEFCVLLEPASAG